MTYLKERHKNCTQKLVLNTVQQSIHSNLLLFLTFLTLEIIKGKVEILNYHSKNGENRRKDDQC